MTKPRKFPIGVVLCDFTAAFAGQEGVLRQRVVGAGGEQLLAPGGDRVAIEELVLEALRVGQVWFVPADGIRAGGTHACAHGRLSAGIARSSSILTIGVLRHSLKQKKRVETCK